MQRLRSIINLQMNSKMYQSRETEVDFQTKEVIPVQKS